MKDIISRACDLAALDRAVNPWFDIGLNIAAAGLMAYYVVNDHDIICGVIGALNLGCAWVNWARWKYDRRP